MTIITWNLQIQSGARSATWSSRTIFRAIQRLARYWVVNMPQVSSGAAMPIILTPSGRWPMWTDVRNRRIYVNASYRWGTSPAGLEQQALALVHEIGHWLGGGGHVSSPGSVMYHTIGDPYMNFTADDMRWFGRLAWKGTARPWNEPNVWRPVTRWNAESLAYDYESVPTIEVGCEPSLLDSWRTWAAGLFGNKVEEIHAS